MSKKKRQHERLVNTLNALLAFANASNDICTYFEPPIDSEKKALRAMRISHELWDSESLITR